MNPKLAVKGINGIIEGGISVTDFSVVTELDEISAKELLYTLDQNGIGTWNDDLVDFDMPNDRLQAALFAITLGATIEEVSEYHTWRDFEAITGIILEENGFHVSKACTDMLGIKDRWFDIHPQGNGFFIGRSK